MNKKLFITLLVVISVFCMNSVVFAWDTNFDAYSNIYSFQINTTNTDYVNATGNAKTSWNNATYKVGLSAVTSSSNKVNWNSSFATGYGLYKHYSLLNYFTITIYDGGIVADFTYTNLPYVRRSVVVHEMGHSLGLAEWTAVTCIMNQNRDRSQIFVPQSDDIAGVNALYY